MRRPTPAESHRARSALLEGHYPPGMKARCALCGKVREIEQGKMMTSQSPMTGATGYFACAECISDEEAA